MEELIQGVRPTAHVTVLNAIALGDFLYQREHENVSPNRTVLVAQASVEGFYGLKRALREAVNAVELPSGRYQNAQWRDTPVRPLHHDEGISITNKKIVKVSMQEYLRETMTGFWTLDKEHGDNGEFTQELHAIPPVIYLFAASKEDGMLPNVWDSFERTLIKQVQGEVPESQKLYGPVAVAIYGPHTANAVRASFGTSLPEQKTLDLEHIALIPFTTSGGPSVRSA